MLEIIGLLAVFGFGARMGRIGRGFGGLYWRIGTLAPQGFFVDLARYRGGTEFVDCTSGTIGPVALAARRGNRKPIVFKRGPMACNGVNYDPFQPCRSSGHLCEKIMKQLTLSATAGGETLMMSSREIAELTGSSHDNVMKTIRALVARGVVLKNETPYTHPQNGQQYPEFLLNYRDTLVVVSGYSPELRARIIDRWQELEAAVTAPVSVEDYAVTRLAALRAAGLLSSVGAEVASFRLLGLRPPQSLVRAMEPIADRQPPVALQLEFRPSAPEPAPARKPRATSPTPAPKPEPLPMLRLTHRYAIMNTDDLSRYTFDEVADAVDGDTKALRAAMIARGWINEFMAPTKKAEGLFVRTGGGVKWYVRKLLRACGAIK